MSKYDRCDICADKKCGGCIVDPIVYAHELIANFIKKMKNWLDENY
jgi:hypothetical protein